MSDRLNGKHAYEERPPIRLTPEQMALAQQGIASLKRGDRLTAAQVREQARKRTLSWLSADHGRPA